MKTRNSVSDLAILSYKPKKEKLKMSNKTRIVVSVLVLIGFVTILSCCCPQASAQIFKPHDGTLWDVSVMYYQGKYYAIMMHGKNEEGEIGWGNPRYILLTSSTDGVHWEEEGCIIEEKALKTICGKPQFAWLGERFILNHSTIGGVHRRNGVGMQLLRFYESTDMKNWTYLYTSQPDPTWYKSLGDPGNRWDAMYMIPKEEGDPSAGYWGYGVGWSKPGVVQGPMMMQSTDGRNWEVLSPPKMDWGDVPPSLMEYSGCERIGGKYYLIGGQFIGSNLGIDRSAGYGIWTAISDHPRGPFRPDKNAYRLCGIQKRDEENMVWLAAWVRGKDNELLVSNSVSIQRRTWMLPLRKAVVDSEGHLRLHWWPGNVALCGEEVPLKTDHVFLQAAEPEKEFNLFELPEELDVQQGFVFEGMFTVKAPIVSGTKNRRTAIGLFMPETETQSKAIELEVGPPDGRESVIGLLKSLPDGEFQLHAQDITRDGFHATMTGVEPGEHHFRLLVRIGCFELYIDDKLMQTYFFEPGVKSVGVFTRNVEAEFKNLRIWKMSLPRSPFPFSPDSESK